MKRKNKLGQIWVETVIYTLIGLTLIGIALAIVTPRINEARERILIEQSIEAINNIDIKINEVLDRGPGNVRVIDSFSMAQGELIIDSINDELRIVIGGLSKPYSEPNVPINQGRVSILSKEGRKDANVTLTLDYSATADIRVDNKEEEKKLTSSSVSYAFTIENLGDLEVPAEDERFVVSIIETSGR